MKFTINQVPAFYQGYVKEAAEQDMLTALETSGRELLALCEGLSESQALFCYEEGKWSIKDLILHMVDGERVFTYRALRFARNDQTELTGFDQDLYVEEAYADKFSLADLLSSFKNARQSTLDLYTSLSESELTRFGTCNQVEMTVEMLGYIIAGHTLHHKRIIEQRYLS